MGKRGPKKGHKYKLTPEAVEAIKVHFSHGATDEQACHAIGITKQTLYNYYEDYPEFRDVRKALKGCVGLQAKKNIVDTIYDGDVANSKWWLERIEKNEYSTQTNTKNESVLTDGDGNAFSKEELDILQRYGVIKEGESQ